MAFFDDTDDEYTGPPLTDLMLRAAEKSLGYRLPARYVELLRERNGGVPLRCCLPVDAPTSWAPDHIEIEALLGIGGEWGIGGDTGSRYMIAEWDYPDIGVVICATPSAGHDTVMLDYSRCGPRGEPSVAYIDDDRSVRTIARSFSELIEKLQPCSRFTVEPRARQGDRTHE